jgi:hypothetical protein
VSAVALIWSMATAMILVVAMARTTRRYSPARFLGRSRSAVRPLLLALAPFLLIPAFASGQDVDPPQLLSEDFSPAVVDVNAAPAMVTVTARVTDDLAGVSVVQARFDSPVDGSRRGFSEPARSMPAAPLGPRFLRATSGSRDPGVVGR